METSRKGILEVALSGSTKFKVVADGKKRFVYARSYADALSLAGGYIKYAFVEMRDDVQGYIGRVWIK